MNSTAQGTGSFRLILKIKGETLEKLSLAEIEMKSPPGVRIVFDSNTTGSRIELRGKDEKVIWSGLIPFIIWQNAEVMTDRKYELLEWHKAPGFEKIISIVIPRIREADHISIISSKPDCGKLKSMEVARFSITKD